MSESWPQVRLGDVSTIVMGQSPLGEDCNRKAIGQPLLNGPTEFGARYPTPAQWTTSPTKWAEPGDVLFCVRGSTTGRMNRADAPYVIGRGVAAIRGSDGADTDFLHYSVVHGLDRLLANATGSTFPNIGRQTLAQFSIAWPDQEQRTRIAGVLGALDDLIEVNRGLIRDLDVMVHLLGRDLLIDKTDHHVVPLTEVAEVSKGYSYKSSELVPGDGWLVNLKNVGRAGTFEARGFKPLTATVKEHQVISNGDVLVAQTDLTQDREVIARPVRVRRGTLEGRLVASLDLAIVRPRPPHTNESIFAVLDSNDFRSHALGYCNGTTVLHMGARALPDYMAPLLGPEEIEEFTARVRPLREAADALSIEIEDLQLTRDELLPLLMSGRVRVHEDGVAA